MTDPAVPQFVAKSKGRVRRLPRRLVVENQTLENHDFRGQHVDHVFVLGSQLKGCDFSGLRADGFTPGIPRQRSTFVECCFDGAKLRLGPSGAARFERCSFQDVTLSDWFWDGVDLVDCVFSGKIRKAVIWGSSPVTNSDPIARSNEISGNDFSRAVFRDVAFRGGVDLSLQRLPHGPDYVYVPDLAGTLDEIRAVVTRWSDLNARREMLLFVELYESTLHGGQRQLLFGIDTSLRRKDRAAEAFAVLLRSHGGVSEGD